MFYYTLSNVDPKYRSSLKAIQLVTVVKHTLVKKYGLDKILEPFVSRVKELEQVTKIEC